MRIPRLRSGGVIVTYACLSRCGHCLYRSSPSRSKDYLDPAEAARIARAILARGCSSVHVGGGEPFLKPQALEAALLALRDEGLAVEYVETNAGWCLDDGATRVILERLLRAGCRTLLVSISPFHAAHIPFARVQRLLAACRDTGVGVFPWIMDFYDDLVAMGPETTHDMDAFRRRFGPDYPRRILQRYWIHPGGRVLETFRDIWPQRPAEDILAASAQPCRELLDTSHFHVDLHGDYIPGLCSGLALPLDDLAGELDSARHPLLSALLARGLPGLYDLAREHGYAPRRPGYAGKCDLCDDIRQFLALDAKWKGVELAPRGHYEEARKH